MQFYCIEYQLVKYFLTFFNYIFKNFSWKFK